MCTFCPTAPVSTLPTARTRTRTTPAVGVPTGGDLVCLDPARSCASPAWELTMWYTAAKAVERVKLETLVGADIHAYQVLLATHPCGHHLGLVDRASYTAGPTLEPKQSAQLLHLQTVALSDPDLRSRLMARRDLVICLGQAIGTYPRWDAGRRGWTQRPERVLEGLGLNGVEAVALRALITGLQRRHPDAARFFTGDLSVVAAAAYIAGISGSRTTVMGAKDRKKPRSRVDLWELKADQITPILQGGWARWKELAAAGGDNGMYESVVAAAEAVLESPIPMDGTVAEHVLTDLQVGDDDGLRGQLEELLALREAGYVMFGGRRHERVPAAEVEARIAEVCDLLGIDDLSLPRNP